MLSPTPKYLYETSSTGKLGSDKQEEKKLFLFVMVEVYHGGISIGPTLFR